MSTSTDPSVFRVVPALNRWSAVGVRAADAQNWDLEARDTTAPFPTCYSGVLAASGGSGVDFLVTDWRFRALQTDYVGAGTPGQTGSAARVQYEQPAFDYQANRPYDLISCNANDVLKVRESELVAGVRYYFEIWPSAGLSGLQFHLFAPITTGTGWAARADRVLEQPLFDGSSNLVTYTPAVTGSYAIVITNEAATAGSFYITVKRCPFSASVLTDNQPRVNVFLDEWPAFQPPAPNWGVVGERGEPGFSYNLDVAPGLRDHNGPYTTCSDSILASQPSGVGVRVIAGDFRANPLRTYTAHVSLEAQPKTNSEGYIEWEDGQDSLVVDAPPTVVTPPAHNVFDAWNVRLEQGATYDFQLAPDAGATASYRMLLFTNPNPGAEYWASRPEAVLDTPSPGTYFAPRTDRYALVVVNDNGGSGGYSIAVSRSLVGVGPLPAGRSRIRAVTPNPSAAGARVDFELARAGRVTLSVADVAGRRVAELSLPEAMAGPGQVVWDGLGEDGARPAAGVYFVTLRLDGRPEGSVKLIVLR